MFLPPPNQPGISRTALGICGYCALIQRHAKFAQLYHDPFAIALFSAAAEGGAELLARLPDWAAVEAALPDLGGDIRLVCHVGWRKRWIGDRVRAALTQGVRQVVVLGAGFDTLSLRFAPVFPEAAFFEVDQQDTSAVKRALLADLFGLPANLRFADVDFEHQTAAQRLAAHGYDPQRQAVFVAEVSLEYVPPEAVSETYRMVADNRAEGSRFLTTYILGRPGNDFRRTFNRSVTAAGEPMRFMPTEAEARAFIRAHGFSLVDWMAGGDVLTFLAAHGIGAGDLPFDPQEQVDSTLAFADLRPG